MTKEEYKKVFDLVEEIMSRSMVSSSEVHWRLSLKVDNLKEELNPDNKEELDYLPTWSCC
jgi:hypothetical protein